MVYLQREEGFDKVKLALTQALADEEPLPMTVVNAGEVLYIVRRERGPEEEARIETILRSLPIDLVDVDLALAREAPVSKQTADSLTPTASPPPSLTSAAPTCSPVTPSSAAAAGA